jgi:ABC-2 type transport system ATP-binding protein
VRDDTVPAVAALEMSGVDKRFGPVHALRGIDLTVQTREVVVLLGANGAGKSTLLRMVAGSVTPDAGRILIAGHDSGADGPRARAVVGWVLGDEHSWYWRLSGRVNLEVFARLRGISARDASAQSDQLLAELGLAAVAERPVAGYSTGMKARLGLARARLGAPSLIVLDEASRGLDRQAEEAFTTWLRAVDRPAVLMATHTLEEASLVGDRMILMSEGQIARELPAGASLDEIKLAIGTPT